MGDRIERSADRNWTFAAAGWRSEPSERRSQARGDRSRPVGRDPLGDPSAGMVGYSLARLPGRLRKPHPVGCRRRHVLCASRNFPGIAALISIYGLFADPASVASHLDAMANVAPGGAIDILREEMTRLASQGGATLGVSFLVSFAISFWTANSGVKAIFDALNIVYGEEEKRSFIKLNIITLFVTLGLVAFILLTLAAVVAVPFALTYIGLIRRQLRLRVHR
jgi:hypothetical protein